FENQFRALGAYFRVRRHGLCNESISSDNAVFPDHGISTKDGGIRVDRHMVADGRVSFQSGKLLSVSCRQRPQRHALIKFDIVTDLGRLPDYNSGAVVNKEIFSDSGSRIDIDPCSSMRIL